MIFPTGDAAIPLELKIAWIVLENCIRLVMILLYIIASDCPFQVLVYTLLNNVKDL